MGRNKDDVQNHFTEPLKEDEFKVKRRKCKHCDSSVSDSVTRMKNHMKICTVMQSENNTQETSMVRHQLMTGPHSIVGSMRRAIGRPRDAISEHFGNTRIAGEFKTKRRPCTYCGTEVSDTTTRMRNHLKVCPNVPREVHAEVMEHSNDLKRARPIDLVAMNQTARLVRKQPVGRPRDIVIEHFGETKEVLDYKLKRRACKHCGTMVSDSATRMRNHINSCSVLLKEQPNFHLPSASEVNKLNADPIRNMSETQQKGLVSLMVRGVFESFRGDNEAVFKTQPSWKHLFSSIFPTQVDTGSELDIAKKYSNSQHIQCCSIVQKTLIQDKRSFCITVEGANNEYGTQNFSVCNPVSYLWNTAKIDSTQPNATLLLIENVKFILSQLNLLFQVENQQIPPLVAIQTDSNSLTMKLNHEQKGYPAYTCGVAGLFQFATDILSQEIISKVVERLDQIFNDPLFRKTGIYGCSSSDMDGKNISYVYSRLQLFFLHQDSLLQIFQQGTTPLAALIRDEHYLYNFTFLRKVLEPIACCICALLDEQTPISMVPVCYIYLKEVYTVQSNAETNFERQKFLHALTTKIDQVYDEYASPLHAVAALMDPYCKFLLEIKRFKIGVDMFEDIVMNAVPQLAKYVGISMNSDVQLLSEIRAWIETKQPSTTIVDKMKTHHPHILWQTMSFETNNSLLCTLGLRIFALPTCARSGRLHRLSPFISEISEVEAKAFSIKYNSTAAMDHAWRQRTTLRGGIKNSHLAHVLNSLTLDTIPLSLHFDSGGAKLDILSVVESGVIAVPGSGYTSHIENPNFSY